MNRILPAALAAALLAISLTPIRAADTPQREPYGIALEGFAYPYPVHLLPVVNDGEQLSMAYMDVAPSSRTAGPWCCCTGAIFRRATGRPSSRC